MEHTVFAWHGSFINDWPDVPKLEAANQNVLIRTRTELNSYKRANLICMFVTIFELLATMPEPDQIDLLEILADEQIKYLGGYYE